MKYDLLEIKAFESEYINRVTCLFKPKSKLHHKWYSVTNDVLNQFGTLYHLLASNPEQIIFETYDHGKPSQVEIIFFNNRLKEIDAIKLSNNWSIGKRIVDLESEKKYEIIDPNGVVSVVEFGFNLYSKSWKSIINKTNSLTI
jgi:hypothetical protein